ncbi:hypothetical protein LCGC14_2850860, partial [marine sediment metagenome]
YSLNTEVGVLHSVINLNQKSELVEISNREMEDAWAASPTIGTPGYYAPFGRDSNDIARVRLYPAPDELHGLLYNYTQEAPFIIGGAAKIVPQVFASLLRHGWMAEYWRWRATQSGSSLGRPTQASQMIPSALANQEEALFGHELNQMVARELRNEPLRRVGLASAYTKHRILRTDPFRITDHRGQMS